MISPFFSYLLEWSYNNYVGPTESGLAEMFGEKLNFMHRAAVTAAFSAILMVVISLMTKYARTPGCERYTWYATRDKSPDEIRPFWRSERPWAILLVTLTICMLLYFR